MAITNTALGALRSVLLLAVVLVMAWARPARADRVDSLISQLESGSAKSRLSAALSLTNLGDKRAIRPFIKALGDSDRTVRGVAATALRKLVDAGVLASLRKLAVRELKKVARSDSSSFVRGQAAKAYKTIEAISSGSSRIFIDLGPMGDKTGRSKTWKRVMVKAAETAFAKTGWKYKGTETAATLRRKKMDAFHIRGTLTKLSSSAGGQGNVVSCKVSMLLATYPSKSMFGFLNGGARVPTGSSARDIKFASRDCIEAVVADLIRKIVGTIKTRVGMP